jgi:putative zinc finger/helix-turn-helix YgiT family protein
MIIKKGTYRYKESGLDNVYLKINIHTCKKCNNIIPAIRKIYAIHEMIAYLLVKKSFLLNGKEIRFIRKQMHLKAVEFAKMLDVTKVTISRWENNKEKIGQASDKLIRLTYTQTYQEKCNKVLKIIDSVETRKAIKKSQKIVMSEKDIKTATCSL